MPRTRRAHYLPRFYLKGFTDEGDNSAFLFVRSKSAQRQWKARADQVAHERDLFKPETPQFSPDELEEGFAEIEGDIAPILRQVIATERLPTGAQMDMLLHLVALNASRPPAEMENLEDNLDQNLRRLVVERLTPEMHRRALQEWRVRGRDTRHIEDLDALKARILGGAVRAVVNRDVLLIEGILGRASLLVDLLGQRSWTLLVAPDGMDFVCSDRPVNLLNKRNVPRGTQARYDDVRWDVIMPLSRRLCLVGHRYGPGGRSNASARTVGFINLLTETGAREYVYSSRENYEVSPEPKFGVENGRAYRWDLGLEHLGSWGTGLGKRAPGH